jgi:hypothetical protein
MDVVVDGEGALIVTGSAASTSDPVETTKTSVNGAVTSTSETTDESENTTTTNSIRSGKDTTTRTNTFEDLS